MTEQASFSNYGKDFQEKLVYLIMTERPFCDQIGEVLDVSFLELKYLQVLTSKIYEYKSKYTTHPSLKVLGSIIKSEVSPEDEAVKEGCSTLKDLLQTLKCCVTVITSKRLH